MIDRKITRALIFAIGVESADVFAWAGGAAERLKKLAARVAQQAEMLERFARVEVQLELVSAQFNGIESKLGRR